MKVTGQLVDIHTRSIYPGEINVEKDLIKRISKTRTAGKVYILPGLIDAHVHIESSMLTPGSFACAAVSRGTTGVVSDPHEIANVMGIDGVRFMIEDGKRVPLKFWFGAPSCVPATSFESSGSTIDAEGVKQLLEIPEVKYLAEMMNFPGVIFNDPEVIKKLKIAREMNLKIDGHAPGLTGENLKKYVAAGISTDHECSSIEEAREKISLGMKIMIREGSAARNLEALKDLLRTNPESIMLCSDDLHPEMLARRHIDKIVAGLIAEGYDMFDVIRSCTLNPAIHYDLETGLLREGDPADFILVEDLKKMEVLETWIDGKKVFDRGNVLFDYSGSVPVNKFNCSRITESDIGVKRKGNKMRVIEAFDGELITSEIIADAGNDDKVNPVPGSDILKIIVKDRYNNAPPAIGFIKGFGLQNGAFASSVAHDSHNIICVGTNDDDIVKAINKVVKLRGGLALSHNSQIESMQLNVGGIMSSLPAGEVAAQYEHLSDIVKSLGCILKAPFMTLSFMALLVIPELKLSDKGLFNGTQFNLVPLFVD
jgi:adenine deaminase